MKRVLERRLSLLVEALLAIVLLAIFLLVVIQVVLRYGFNTSITGANEWITVLFVYTTALGAAVAAGRREHIAIDIAVDWIPLKWRRWRDALVLLLVMLINLVMVFYSFHWIGITGDYLMPSTGLPRWVVLISVPLGCGLAVFLCGLRLPSVLRGEEKAGTFGEEEEV
ncbi:MAG: TRAP transporter small permease [Verrucomicrobiota bacterium]